MVFSWINWVYFPGGGRTFEIVRSSLYNSVFRDGFSQPWGSGGCGDCGFAEWPVGCGSYARSGVRNDFIQELHWGQVVTLTRPKIKRSKCNARWLSYRAAGHISAAAVTICAPGAEASWLGSVWSFTA